MEDKAHAPTLHELSAFTANPLFDELVSLLQSTYSARVCIEYSGDRVLLGWNVKIKKAGKTLCTLYPRSGFFHMLLVIGPKEKEAVAHRLPGFSEEFRAVYDRTPEGMGQRWLVLDFTQASPLYLDALAVIRLRAGGRRQEIDPGV